MAGDYPALGFNPAPGSVATITDMADSLSTIATQLGEAHTDLTQVGKAGGIWTGDASEAFAKTVEELPELLEKGNQSMSSAATALNGWAADLKTMQRDADEYETQAAAALKAFNSALANPNLNLAGHTFQEGAQLQQAQAALDRAEASLRTAGEKLEEIRAAARRLFTQHIELGAKVAAALQKAKEEAPEETNIFEEAASAIGDALESISDILAVLGDILSAIGSALGVLALITSWIPGVNAITAAAAAGVSAAAAGTKMLAKAGGADVSWTSIAMDGLGVIPGGRLGRAAKLDDVGDASKAATTMAKGGTAGRTFTGAKKAAFQAGWSSAKKSWTAKKVDIDPLRDLASGLRRGDTPNIIRDAALKSHNTNINFLNKALGTNFDPASIAGRVASTGAETAKGLAFRGAVQYGSNQIFE